MHFLNTNSAMAGKFAALQLEGLASQKIRVILCSLPANWMHNDSRFRMLETHQHNTRLSEPLKYSSFIQFHNYPSIISDCFKRSPVFRIGGDEFLVILQNRDFESREALFEQLESDCSNTFIETENEKLPIRIAKGFAAFDPDTDKQIADVFHRADEEMYKNKKLMKMAQI